MKDSHLAFYLWLMAFSWKNPLCNTVDNYFQKNGFPLAFSLFSLKIFTPQTSKHYSLNTFVFDKCFHQKNKERRVWYQLLLSFNFRLTLLFTEAFALISRYFLPTLLLIPKQNYVLNNQSFWDSALLRGTKIIAQTCCTKVIQKLVQPFLKKIVPLAQKIWIIWIRLLKCPWKMTSAFRIRGAVSKICLKHPVIFVWVLNWIFFIVFWFLLCIVPV